MTSFEQLLSQFLRTTLRNEMWNHISEHGRLTCATYSAACVVVAATLGQEWTEKHIGRTDKVCDYFKAKKHDHEELIRYMSRVTELGDLIYNLHGVGGFDERINSIRSDDKTAWSRESQS
jgi:hypothetical protein